MPRVAPRFRATRRTALLALATTGLSEMARAQLSLGGVLGKLAGQKPSGPAPRKPAEQLTPGRQGLFAGGYAQRFEPVRDMIARADYADALLAFAPVARPAGAAASVPASAPASATGPASPAPLTTDPFLANAEAGLIDFESADLDAAIDRLKQAEQVREQAKGLGHTVGRTFGWMGEKISGHGELAPYHPFDYEAVLQLNYLALAHLLKGQPTCYNVARRCIDFQQELKAKFDQELSDARAKLAQQKADEAKKPAPKDEAGKAAAAAQQKSIDDFSNEFCGFDTIAQRVPNAYVNPLGDYLAGLIQEIASREQIALRDNARLAYEGAGRLCNGSPQMTAAAAAMKRAHAPASERVVHVIVGEGFAPARQELFFVLALVGQLLPIRVPIFTPVPSAVDHLDIRAGTARLALLDPIGDFEAIRMRSQQDRAPLITLDVTATLIASYLEGRAAHQIGWVGDMLYGVKEASAHADTRSWLSLPRRFHVARVVLPVNATSVTLNAYARDGQRLASEHVAIPKGESQTVLYARSADGHLAVQSARRLWIDGQLEVDTHV